MYRNIHNVHLIEKKSFCITQYHLEGTSTKKKSDFLRRAETSSSLPLLSWAGVSGVYVWWRCLSTSNFALVEHGKIIHVSGFTREF